LPVVTHWQLVERNDFQITQLVRSVYLKRYDPTVEDSFRKQVVVEGKAVQLEILDTAGAELFAAMRDLYMKNGDGFIIVYSITNSKSFAEAANIFQNIIRVRKRYHFPLMLVGNKCDDAENRQVLPSEGEQTAAQFNSTFCEASAKANIHVFDIFEDIVKQIRMEEKIMKSTSHQKRWYPENDHSACCFM
uniref:Ras-related protein Rap-1b n=1 Tax=Toxocara canis TaxID=6265 RepID=A0A183V001_TOXCA